MRKPTTKVNTHGSGSTAANGDISSDITNSLLGLDMTSSPTATEPTAALAAKGIPRLTAGPNVDRWFEKLLYSADGVLYEDVQIQIGVKSRYHGPLGQVAVYIGNKMSAPLTSFTTALHTEEPEALAASFVKIAPSTLAPRTQIQQIVQVECKKIFKVPPILVVSFLAGAHQTIAVRLPIVITKFLEGVKLGSADFFERWKLIGGPPREAQSIFPISLDATGHIDTARQRQVVSGYGFSILEGVDPNPSNVVGAGILHTAVDGKVGCLLRLEPNREAKVRSSLCISFRLSCSHQRSAFSRNDPQHVGGRRRRGAEARAETASSRRVWSRREAHYWMTLRCDDVVCLMFPRSVAWTDLLDCIQPTKHRGLMHNNTKPQTARESETRDSNIIWRRVDRLLSSCQDGSEDVFAPLPCVIVHRAVGRWRLQRIRHRLPRQRGIRGR